MSRMIDRLRDAMDKDVTLREDALPLGERLGAGLPKETGSSAVLRPALASLLKHDLPVILADNVAEYIDTAKKWPYNEVWSLPDACPNVAPPWRTFWIEWRWPVGIAKEMTVMVHGEDSDLAMPKGTVPVGENPANYHMGVLIHAISYQQEHVTNDLFFPDTPAVGAWGLLIENWWEVKPGSFVRGLYYWFNVDKYGKAIPHPAYGFFPVPFPHVRAEMEAIERAGDKPSRSFLFCYPAFLALSFLHCRNVKVVEAAPKTEKSQRHIKITGRPLYRWHTLEITPMKKVLQHEGQAEKVGLKQALHICRGHFKHFINHGLFGRYYGTFWWQDQVRGTVDAVVEKDYRLNLNK